MTKSYVSLLSVFALAFAIGCTKKSEVSEKPEAVTLGDNSQVVSPSPSPEMSQPSAVAPETKAESKAKTSSVSKPRPQQKATSIAPEKGSQVAMSSAPRSSESAPAILEAVSGNIEKQDNNFAFSMFAGHSGAMKTSEGRSFSEFLLEGKYFFDKNNIIGLGQDAKKLYEIAAMGEDEFLPGDTRIFYEHKMGVYPGGSEWSLETGATLPISKTSRDAKNVTQTYVAVHARNSIFNDRVKIGVSPTAAYRWNQYATNSAGVPSEKIILGVQAEAMCEIVPQKLSLVVWGKGFYRVFEEYDYSKTSPSPSTSFGVGSYLSYQLAQPVAIQVGVVRGTTLLPEVRYDDSFYDREATRYYAGVRVDL